MTKSIKSAVCATIILICIGFSSCSDTDPQPINNQRILINDTSSTTGSLVVEVLNVNGDKVEDANVFLYTDFFALERNIHLLTLRTNRQGFSDFGFLNIGDYYIVSEDLAQTMSDTSVVQVRSQKAVLKRVILN